MAYLTPPAHCVRQPKYRRRSRYSRRIPSLENRCIIETRELKHPNLSACDDSALTKMTTHHSPLTTHQPPPTKYLIGIDLGTTNSALAYIDLRSVRKGAKPDIQVFQVPQLTA